jgi:hypothetical protein
MRVSTNIRGTKACWPIEQLLHGAKVLFAKREKKCYTTKSCVNDHLMSVYFVRFYTHKK